MIAKGKDTIRVNHRTTVGNELRYKRFLLDTIHWDEGVIEGAKYVTMLNMLHSTTFTYYTVYNDRPSLDENCALKGLDLRRKWYREHSKLEPDTSKPCSVLEMMVALAMAIDETVFDFDIGPRNHIWFWNMIKNLGLSGFTDDKYFENPDKFINDFYTIISNFMTKRYLKNGKGGLFYIRGYQGDIRDKDIWMQANEWLIKNNLY